MTPRAPPAHARPPEVADVRAAVLALSAGIFAGAASMRGLDPALPSIAASFHTSVGTSGLVVMAYAVAYGLGQGLSGPLGDRAGLYRVVRLACAASAVVTLTCAFAPSLPVLVGLRIAAGAAAASIGPLSMAWVSEVTPDAQRPAVIARTTGASILGMLAGQIGGGVIAEVLNWRAIFGVVALLFAVAAATLWRMEGRVPRVSMAHGVGSVRQTPPRGGLFHLLRRREVRQVLAAVGGEGFAMYISLPFVGASLQARFAIGSARSGLMLMLFGAGGLLFVSFAAPVVARTRETTRCLAGAALLGGSYALLAGSRSAAASVAALLAMGFGFFMFHNLLQVAATRMAPDARGSATAAFAAVFFLSSAAGTLLGGVVLDRFGSTPLFLLSAAGLVALGAVLAVRRSATLAVRPLGGHNSPPPGGPDPTGTRPSA